MSSRAERRTQATPGASRRSYIQPWCFVQRTQPSPPQASAGQASEREASRESSSSSLTRQLEAGAGEPTPSSSSSPAPRRSVGSTPEQGIAAEGPVKAPARLSSANELRGEGGRDLAWALGLAGSVCCLRVLQDEASGRASRTIKGASWTPQGSSSHWRRAVCCQ